MTKLFQLVASSWILGNLVLAMAKLWERIPVLKSYVNFPLKAASEAGFQTYRDLVYSHVPSTHSSVLDGEFIGSSYFGFSFHFAFVSGFFFPAFLQQAVENPALFYLIEITSSATIAIILTTLMISGHMGVMVFAAYQTNNLSEQIEQEWDKKLSGDFFTKFRFFLSFLLIPGGKFPGVLKEGLSFKIDGESPLEVSKAGPMNWDRRVSWLSWSIAIPLIMLATASSIGHFHLPAAVEWLTRIIIPLAFISTLGTYLTGRGAFKSFIVEKTYAAKKPTEHQQKFDLADVKQAFIKGE